MRKVTEPGKTTFKCFYSIAPCLFVCLFLWLLLLLLLWPLTVDWWARMPSKPFLPLCIFSLFFLIIFDIFLTHVLVMINGAWGFIHVFNQPRAHCCSTKEAYCRMQTIWLFSTLRVLDRMANTSIKQNLLKNWEWKISKFQVAISRGIFLDHLYIIIIKRRKKTERVIKLKISLRDEDVKIPVILSMCTLVLALTDLSGTSFFSNKGSLTTPPCYQSVKWIVLYQPTPAKYKSGKINLLFTICDRVKIRCQISPIPPSPHRTLVSDL